MDEAWARLAGGRVGHLATVRPDGGPHIVPMVFALSEGRVVTAIDWKPKRGRRLQRLANIEANPTVAFMVHSYSEDWATLWWVRVDGTATIHDRDAVWDAAVSALQAKYHQYRERPPRGEVISIAPGRISSWAGNG